MSNILDDWKKVLDNFQASVSKDLDEIHKQKAEIEQIKLEMFNRLESCKYIRDERRLVLSAPEIIIGNVNKDGMLSGIGGRVIVKGSEVMLDGAGPYGRIVNRATTVQQIAVDPGLDGLEAAVYPHSSITSQARNIVLQSNDSKDYFSQMPALSTSGVIIHSDTTMQIEATASVKQRKDAIESQTSELKSKLFSLNLDIQKQKLELEADLLQLKALMLPNDALTSEEMITRASFQELQDVHDKVEELFPKLYQESVEFIHKVSVLAEMNRIVDALDKEKAALTPEDDFKKKSTNTGLFLASEYMELDSLDGDGNLRENPGAGILVNTPRMHVAMQKTDGSLIDDSYMTIQAQSVGISTANPKVSETSTDMPAEGNVSIVSKKINLSAVDYEVKDKKAKKKALTKGGKITLRAETMNLNATDTEGKATGSVGINAKTVELKSMDVDKDKHTDKELAKGSSMLILAEKMFVGAKDDKTKSKSLQAVSEELGLFADKTLEAQQDKGKALVQLAGGNTAIGGSKTEIYGATTIQAKTEIKDELKAPKATIDNIEAKSSFKSTNISDGIAVPAPPSSAKLSAKLKAEDAPKNS